MEVAVTCYLTFHFSTSALPHFAASFNKYQAPPFSLSESWNIPLDFLFCDGKGSLFRLSFKGPVPTLHWEFNMIAQRLH
jgi:hypothetical protein